MTKEYYELTVYAYYGNSDGEEERCKETFTNLSDLKEFLANEYNIGEHSKFEEGSYHDLVSGANHYCEEACYGDWDDPTSFSYYVEKVSYIKELYNLRLKYEQDKAELKEKYAKLESNN